MNAKLTHDLEESLGVHALRRAEVGSGLLQRLHRGTDSVYGSDARDQREDYY